MTTTPAIRAISDQLLGHTLGMELREEGFRKRGRTWWRDEAGGRRVVGYGGSWSNTTTEGRLFVALGVSFAELGDDLTVAPSPHSCRLSFGLERLGPEPGEVLAYEIDATDTRKIEELEARLGDDWRQFGLPLLRSATSPRSLVEHIGATGNVETVKAAVEVVRSLGDNTLLRGLAKRGLVAARSRRQWRYLARDRHPLELGLQPWAWLLRLADETDVEVTEEDCAAALAVIADAAGGTLAGAFHTGTDEAAALYLAGRLGVEPPTFAEMKPANRSV
jgi:hypothetical protein